MNPIRSNILVNFHDEIDTPLNLIIPERYTIHEQASADDNESRMGVTTDRRLINPQMCSVLTGKYAGEEAFLYYGAYEMAKWVDDKAILPDSVLLFLLNPIRMMDGIYLGEEVSAEPERTDSGLYLTPALNDIDTGKVKILYTPKNSTIQPGDIVITTDSAQYWLLYGGKKYLMVKEQFIAGVNGKAYGENMLIEYIPDADAPERDAKNDRIKAQIDFMKQHGMHYQESDFEPIKEPKFVKAKIIGENDTLLVYRNYGVPVGKNRAIIPPDALVGTFYEG